MNNIGGVIQLRVWYNHQINIFEVFFRDMQDDLSTIRRVLAPVLNEATTLRISGAFSIDGLDSDAIIQSLYGLRTGFMSVEDNLFFGKK